MGVSWLFFGKASLLYLFFVSLPSWLINLALTGLWGREKNNQKGLMCWVDPAFTGGHVGQRYLWVRSAVHHPWNCVHQSFGERPLHLWLQNWAFCGRCPCWEWEPFPPSLCAASSQDAAGAGKGGLAGCFWHKLQHGVGVRWEGSVVGNSSACPMGRAGSRKEDLCLRAACSEGMCALGAKF